MFSPLAEAPYHNVLQGSVFECSVLLDWIAGVISYDLRNTSPPIPPTEFTIEHWFAKKTIYANGN